MNLSETKVLIFDLDGTLLNTLNDLHNSVCHALHEAGLPLLEKEATRRYLGNGIKKLISQCVSHVCPDADEGLKEQVLTTFHTHYVQHAADQTAPYEGILPMLRDCQKRGFLTAIVSNKLEAAVKDLHRVFFADFIDISIGETPTVKRKPAPDMVEEAIRQLSMLHGLKIRKQECAYIGDSEVDLQTAQNAGLPCIAVSWGFRNREWLTQCGAQTIIDHPCQLLSLFP